MKCRISGMKCKKQALPVGESALIPYVPFLGL